MSMDFALESLDLADIYSSIRFIFWGSTAPSFMSLHWACFSRSMSFLYCRLQSWMSTPGGVSPEWVRGAESPVSPCWSCPGCCWLPGLWVYLAGSCWPFVNKNPQFFLLRFALNKFALCEEICLIRGNEQYFSTLIKILMGFFKHYSCLEMFKMPSWLICFSQTVKIMAVC